MNRSKILTFTLLFLLLAGARSVPAAAEPAAPPSEESVLQEVERLRALKESNPALYREMIDEKKNSLKGNLNRLQQRNPERAQRFFERQKQMKRRELDYVQKHRPGMYREFSENRKQFWERRAQENPQQFQKFMESRPELRKRWESLRGSGRGFKREQPGKEPPRGSGFREKKRSREADEINPRGQGPQEGPRQAAERGFRGAEGRRPGGGHRRSRN